jgi:hypothetical protein
MNGIVPIFYPYRTTNVPRGMPVKDLTSDGQSSFAMNRREYMDTVVAENKEKEIQTYKLKKFTGGCRDASDIIRKRRVAEIGVGSLNTDQKQMSFVETKDTNTKREALRRVRAGGSYVVPNKCKSNTSMF